jgi:hypothetical protein
MAIDTPVPLAASRRRVEAGTLSGRLVLLAGVRCREADDTGQRRSGHRSGRFAPQNASRVGSVDTPR